MKKHLTAFLLFTAFTAALWPGDNVTIRDSRVVLRHFRYDLTPDRMIGKIDRDRIVATAWPAKIIENGLIRVTLVPDLGARILSIVYKPTGHELLYQNPVGNVFNWKQNTFYYDYLVVWGGIFPTFPEPEHGKAWCLPWEQHIVVSNEEIVSLEMKFTDTIDRNKKTPRQFRYGKTWTTCAVTVTVRKDSSAVEMNVKLQNNRPEFILSEYWTCMTLAPGSRPGRTASPGSTELFVPQTWMTLKNNWWPWMAGANGGLSNTVENVFTYNRLRYFSNWTDMGIAYAYPRVTNTWYGVLNHDNHVGIFRVTRRTNDTPGLKLWTWGYGQSRKTDPKNSGDPRRPYIELWAGISTEFFTPVKLKPMQKKNWSEFYIPTVGLTNVNFANEKIAGYFSCVKDAARTNLTLTAELFPSMSRVKWNADFLLSGWNKDILMTNLSFTGDPGKAVAVRMHLAVRKLGPGALGFRLVIKNEKGEEIASSRIPYIK